MRIHSLQLQNFRNFNGTEEGHRFDFPERFTLVIGENGRGKTAILRAARIAVGPFLYPMSAELSAQDKKISTIEDEDVHRIELENRFVKQYPCKITTTGSIDGDTHSWYSIKKSERNTPSEGVQPLVDHASELVRQVNEELREDITLPVLCYFSTARLWLEPNKTIQEKPKGFLFKDGYARCLDDRSDKHTPREWIASYDRKRLKGDPKSVLLDAVYEAIETCIPGWSNLEWSEDDNDLTGVYQLQGKDVARVPLYFLSDGLRTMASMVAEIAYRCVSINPHLGSNAVKESEGVIMIDELDLHLHPKWQRHVVRDLKRAFPNLQFICTTHSPFILQSVTARELINLDDRGLEDDPTKYGIEDVAEEEMGVKNVARSEDFLEKIRVAEEYYSLIQKGKTSQTNENVDKLRQQLNELEDRFSTDAAFVGQLRAERKLYRL